MGNLTHPRVKLWSFSIRPEVLVKSVDNFMWRTEQHFPVALMKPITTTRIALKTKQQLRRGFNLRAKGNGLSGCSGIPEF